MGSVGWSIYFQMGDEIFKRSVFGDEQSWIGISARSHIEAERIAVIISQS